MYNRDVLPNGVRVVTERITYVQSVSLGIWIGAGSRHETDAQAGISHFIEHMMFKGTHRRSARDIAEALDAVGGRMNAFTDKEYTCYYAKVLSEHLPLAFDVLSDMLLNSRLDEEEVERERNVVLEEIKRHDDSPEDLIHDIFAQALWPGHPLGRPVIGTPEVVASFQADQLRQFMDRWYTPDAIVVAAAGNVQHAQVVELADRYLGGLSGSTPSVQLTVPQAQPGHTHVTRTTEQVHICVGTAGLPFDSEDRYAMAVLDTAYGGGMSSRLFQEIRESRGLVYSIGSYSSSYRQAGLFAVYAGTSRETAGEVMRLVAEEEARLRTDGITAEELERAKMQIRGSLLLGLESMSTRMTRLGKSELYFGRIITVDEVLAGVQAVTLDDVQRLAAKLLQDGRHTVAAIGPAEGVEVA